MSEHTDIDAARLTILLDIRHPECYLALPPALALAEAEQLEVSWLPLVAPPLRPPTPPGPDDDRGVLHRRHRAHAIAREIETYSRAQGLVLRELYRDPDPWAFNLGWLWLRERSGERLSAYLLEAFRAYWSLELDPSSASAIAALLDSLGTDGGAFEVWSRAEGPRRAERVAEALRGSGASGVPGYMVDGEFFLGRQHLPMIRWILGGREGPGPI